MRALWVSEHPPRQTHIIYNFWCTILSILKHVEMQFEKVKYIQILPFDCPIVQTIKTFH